MIDVPFSFYLKMGLKVTLMAIGTCLVLGYFFLSIWFLGLAIAIAGPPIMIFKYFWDRRNGAMEYIYRNDLLKQKARSFIISRFGVRRYFSILFLKLWGRLGNPKTAYIEILENYSREMSDEVQYFLLIEVSRILVREDDYKKAIEYLLKAHQLLENRLVVNIKLAQTFEYIGDVIQAERYYQKATSDPLNSEKLNKFIGTQIERVKTKGPCKQPPALGARYILR